MIFLVSGDPTPQLAFFRLPLIDFRDFNHPFNNCGIENGLVDVVPANVNIVELNDFLPLGHIRPLSREERQ